jgi:hypothetical protein
VEGETENEPSEQEKEAGCKPSLFTISSQKTIGSFVSFGYGIVGLYITVVFTIGRFVHMSVMNAHYGVSHPRQL